MYKQQFTINFCGKSFRKEKKELKSKLVFDVVCAHKMMTFSTQTAGHDTGLMATQSLASWC